MSNMRKYNVKTVPGSTEYIEILKEMDDAMLVCFTRIRDGYVKKTEETLSKQLFDMCLQTGYLNPMTVSAAA